MDSAAGTALHRIEALPGSGRYAVTFRAADGTEQTATVRVTDIDVDVAEASLPATWRRANAAFAMLAAAVRALDAAASFAPPPQQLLDIDGGWDVSLGNVVLAADGRPACIAHGPLEQQADGVWACPECGATGLLRS
ncbi:hypothetical protein [uncultured Jatrophihabitans sp.]|uniref:hypothetical protein n=1 Tax=uncultured Jatrophihabitans sp. TaxID=1610747 RepID=UPI0035CB77F0